MLMKKGILILLSVLLILTVFSKNIPIKIANERIHEKNILYGIQYNDPYHHHYSNDTSRLALRLCLHSKNKQNYYGLILSWIDLKEKYLPTFSGINCGLFNSNVKVCHGLSLNIIINADSIDNGISTGLSFNGGYMRNGIAISFLSKYKKANGIIIGGFVSIANKMNGLNIGMGTFSDTLNGIALSVYLNNSQLTNGLAVSLVNHSTKLNGLMIGLINLSNNGKGIQIGLLNHMKNNPKWLRLLPIINIKWTRK